MKVIEIGTVRVRQIESGESIYGVYTKDDARIGTLEKTAYGSWDTFHNFRDNARRRVGTGAGLERMVRRHFRHEIGA